MHQWELLNYTKIQSMELLKSLSLCDLVVQCVADELLSIFLSVVSVQEFVSFVIAVTSVILMLFRCLERQKK